MKRLLESSFVMMITIARVNSIPPGRFSPSPWPGLEATFDHAPHTAFLQSYNVHVHAYTCTGVNTMHWAQNKIYRYMYMYTCTMYMYQCYEQAPILTCWGMRSSVVHGKHNTNGKLQTERTQLYCTLGVPSLTLSGSWLGGRLWRLRWQSSQSQGVPGSTPGGAGAPSWWHASESCLA